MFFKLVVMSGLLRMYSLKVMVFKSVCQCKVWLDTYQGYTTATFKINSNARRIFDCRLLVMILFDLFAHPQNSLLYLSMSLILALYANSIFSIAILDWIFCLLTN